MRSLTCLVLWTLLASGLASTAPSDDSYGKQREAGQRLKSWTGRDQQSLRVDAVSSVEPEQVHIALADARSRELYAMSVSWLTWTDARSQVLWGRDMDVLEEVVVGNATRETEETLAMILVTFFPSLLENMTGSRAVPHPL